MTKQTLDQITQQLAQNYITQEELVGESGIFDKLFQKTLGFFTKGKKMKYGIPVMFMQKNECVIF